MAPVLAAHRAASAMAVVMITLWMLREDPEMLAVLMMICQAPELIAMTLLMTALAIPEPEAVSAR
jgi:hypothetical protein